MEVKLPQSLNVYLPKESTPSPRITLSNDEHPAKTSCPITLALFTVAELSAVQPLKAKSLITTTLLGITTEANALHVEKAVSSIEITVFGIAIEAKLLHPTKALVPIHLVPFLMEYVFLVKSLTTPTKYVSAYRIPPSNGKEKQLAKTELPISVTLLGIVTEAKFSHISKASSPIDVTPDGMATDFRLRQS